MAINIGKNSDGDVTYQNPPINRTLFPNITEYSTPEEIEAFVNAWLDDHPEATTTVEDGSILPVKLNSTNSASDGYVLSYNATEGKFEWYDIGGELDEINSDITDLKQDLTEVKGILLEYVEPVNLWDGTYTEDTFINSQGEVITQQGYSLTDYFTVEPGKYVCFTRAMTASTRGAETSNVAIAFFDENKTFISRETGQVKAVPNNARYARQNIPTTYASSNYKPMVEYCNSDGSGISTSYKVYFPPYYHELSTDFRGKKICTFGDSIAASDNGVRDTYTWIEMVKNYFGASVAYNRGIGGSCVTSETSGGEARTGYAYVNADGDAGETRLVYTTERTFADYPTSISPWMESKDRANTIPTDTDVVVIIAGSNDVGTTSTALFKEAYGTMIENIMARVPNAMIFPCTLPFHSIYDTAVDAGNNAYENFRTAIRDVAKKYGFPCIELRDKMGVNAVNYETYMNDSVHFNKPAGRQRTAECIIATLKGYSHIVAG